MRARGDRCPGHLVRMRRHRPGMAPPRRRRSSGRSRAISPTNLSPSRSIQHWRAATLAAMRRRLLQRPAGDQDFGVGLVGPAARTAFRRTRRSRQARGSYSITPPLARRRTVCRNSPSGRTARSGCARSSRTASRGSGTARASRARAGRHGQPSASSTAIRLSRRW